jgi:excinuclease UvrABC helicase subunit UvrB
MYIQGVGDIMYEISKVKKQIEDLREEIHTKIDKDGIENICEILKLSEELDGFINIWNNIYYRYTAIS